MAPLHLSANLEGVEAGARAVAALSANWLLRHRLSCATAQGGGDDGAAAGVVRGGGRRFGFHGLSIASILAALQRQGVDIERERLIVAHLGAGASMTAIKGGRSIETSMGFSTVSGLPMATRSGDVDAGVVLHLARSGRSVDEVEDLLYRQSGLLGLSGLSGDMALLVASREAAAAEAVEAFCLAGRRWLAGLAGVLGGVDRVVFTGGIGEHAPRVRARICEDLGFMGVGLDEAANSVGLGLISPPGAQVLVEVRAADEEAEIGRQTRAFMAGAGPTAAR